MNHYDPKKLAEIRAEPKRRPKTFIWSFNDTELYPKHTFNDRKLTPERMEIAFNRFRGEMRDYIYARLQSFFIKFSDTIWDKDELREKLSLEFDLEDFLEQASRMEEINHKFPDYHISLFLELGDNKIKLKNQESSDKLEYAAEINRPFIKSHQEQMEEWERTAEEVRQQKKQAKITKPKKISKKAQKLAQEKVQEELDKELDSMMADLESNLEDVSDETEENLNLDF